MVHHDSSHDAFDEMLLGDEKTSLFSSGRKKRNKKISSNMEEFIKDQQSDGIVSYEQGNSKTFKGVPGEWH
jgi:hypothetical protein